MKKTKICAALTAAVCFSSVFASMPNFIVPSYAAEIVSNDFEVEYEGWHGTSPEFEIAAVNGAGYGGSRGMVAAGRTSPEDGAASSKGLWLWGGVKYKYSVDVFAETDETFHVNLVYIEEGSEEEISVELITEDVKGGEWASLSSSFKAPEGAYEFRVSITTDSTNDFRFDNFLVTEKRDANTAVAAPAGKGLKDEFADYFRVGNILNGGTVQNSAITAIMLKDHNALECENETKPDATIVQNGSTDTNVKVSSNRFAAIADFCSKNGIGFRGHTLVWHSQTPEWFFKQNFSDNGGYVTKDVMEQRMESYIKNMFNMYATQYPNLDLYAYDVCNEVINDGTASQGGLRPTNGTNGQNGSSAWVRVYGNNSFVESAFKYARRYAPQSCKLYYNDYNEFANDKQNCIINTIIKPLKEKGLIDGMGMQSHLNCAASGAWGDTNSYLAAMDKYLNLGIDVQVTELDLAREGGVYSDAQQATKYKAIFQHCVDWNKNHPNGPNVTLVQVWGPNDNNSWVRVKDRDESKPNYPLLYDGNNQPKSAYTAIQSIIPDNEWGTGLPYTGPGSSGFTPKPIEKIKPDENGIYFHHTFEGDDFGWTGRGGASVEVSSSEAYGGSNSLYCSGRTAAWNGAAFAISTNPFEPGEKFTFSALARSADSADSVSLKFTLQYTGSDGEAHYKAIAEEVVPSGAWVQLINKEFEIPEEASSMQIYVETSDESTGNFYIDDVYAAVAGKDIAGPSKPIVRTLNVGDATFDGVINVFDIIAVRRGLINGISDALALRAADADQNGTLEVADLVLIQNYVLGRIKEFPEPPIVKPDVSKFEAAFSSVTANSSWKLDGENNPLTTQRFGADPGWMVYKDRLYLYTTNDAFEHDNQGRLRENTYYSGTINCISTADMVNWTDHGAIPVAGKETSNGPAKWANRAWAPDALWKTDPKTGKDKFYLYFANSGGGIGVLTADSPVGPWTDPLGKPLLDWNTPGNSGVVWMFDPGVYYDPESGKGYIAFGGGVDGKDKANPKTGRIAELGDDMISINGSTVTMETPYLFEDSSLIKIGDTWYYSYCTNWNVPWNNTTNGVSFGSGEICYMTSKTPLGSWTSANLAGKVLPGTGAVDQGGNNHHSIIYFKDKYYVAYHTRKQATRMSAELGYKYYNNKGELTDSKDGNYRSTHINEASYNPSTGKITCSIDMKGTSQIEKLDVYSKVQAETMSNQSKKVTVEGLYDTTVKASKGEWIKVSGADLSKGVKSITAKGKGGSIRFTTGSPDGDVIGYLDLSSGEETTLGAVSSPSGTKDIYITFSGDATLDYWFFS